MRKNRIKEDWWKPVFGKFYADGFIPLLSVESTTKEVKFIIKILNLKKGDKILDIPCGNGRHSIALAEKGMEVVGVDFSKILLKLAKKHAQKKGLSINFIQADMRAFKSNEKFDSVLVLGNSFGYFSDQDNQKFLKLISKTVKQKGAILLDLPNSNREFCVKKKPQKFSIPGGYMIADEIDFQPRKMTAEIGWTVKKNKQEKNMVGWLRYYTLSEIKNMLTGNDFEIQKIFGSFEKNKYNNKSPRMIIVARKMSKNYNKRHQK